MMLGESDRVVHASLVEDDVHHEVVRYDRQGRWYHEEFPHVLGATPALSWDARTRIASVSDAVQKALDLESRGGTVHVGRPGGKHFDYMVGAARDRAARGR